MVIQGSPHPRWSCCAASAVGARQNASGGRRRNGAKPGAIIASVAPEVVHEAIATCPVCEHELSVTRLHCAECGTTLEGRFNLGRFSRLNREQLGLLESFLRSRGNLREMERDLGLSYPTIRGRLDALVRTVGLGEPREPVAEAGPEAAAEPGPAAPAPASPVADPRNRRRLLERLARGEISAEEAARELRRGGTGGE